MSAAEPPPLKPAPAREERNYDLEQLGPACARFYRSDVDGLRWVAVAAVFVYHLDNSWLPGGFVGVDVFFVISGFVVTGSLLSRPSPSVLQYLAGFYARRAKRLGPSLALVVATTGLLMAACIPPSIPELKAYYLTGMFSLLGCANVFFAAQSRGYFDQPADTLTNPFLHTWSLGVEEQFYLVFPLLLLLAYRARAAETVPKGPEWLTPTAVLGASIAGSAAACGMLSSTNPTLAFYILPSRLWQLATGALLYDVISGEEYQLFITSRPSVTTVLNLAALLLLTSAMAGTPGAGFPVLWVLAAVSGAVCFIAAGESPHAPLNWLLACRVPAYLGKLSYAIYLWHWPAIVMLKWRVSIDELPAARFAAVLAATLASVVLLSAATFHLIERPLRRWSPERLHKVYGFVLVMLVGSLVWLHLLRGPMFGSLYRDSPLDRPHTGSNLTSALHNGSNLTSALHNGSNLTSALRCHDLHGWTRADSCMAIGSGAYLMAGGGVDLHPEAADLHAEAASVQKQCACRVVDPTLHTPPYLVRGDGPSVDSSTCGPCFVEQGTRLEMRSLPDHWKAYWNKPEDLKFNRSADRMRPSLFVLGDSHGLHMRLAVTPGYGVLSSYSVRRFSTSNVPPRQLAGILQGLLRPRDIVAVSFQFEHYAKAQWRQPWTAWLRKMQQQARSKGALLMLLSDVPRRTDYNNKGGTASGPACVPTKGKPTVSKRCFMSKSEVLKEMAPLYKTWSDLSDLPGVFFFDFFRLFCSGDVCGAMIPGTGTVAYKDGNHLSDAGSLYLWPYLCTALARALAANTSSRANAAHTKR